MTCKAARSPSSDRRHPAQTSLTPTWRRYHQNRRSRTVPLSPTSPAPWSPIGPTRSIWRRLIPSRIRPHQAPRRGCSARAPCHRHHRLRPQAHQPPAHPYRPLMRPRRLRLPRHRPNRRPHLRRPGHRLPPYKVLRWPRRALRRKPLPARHRGLQRKTYHWRRRAPQRCPPPRQHHRPPSPQRRPPRPTCPECRHHGPRLRPHPPHRPSPLPGRWHQRR